jgi:hypothetical protein
VLCVGWVKSSFCEHRIYSDRDVIFVDHDFNIEKVFVDGEAKEKKKKGCGSTVVGILNPS